MPARTRKAGAPSYTLPGLKPETASEVIALLQDRLNSLNDLALTLKHVHWNVVGPCFIAVHTMLDPQVDAVREMVDDLAERIATLGGSPVGTRAPWSRSVAGTTTGSAGPTRTSTWQRSTWCTAG